MQCQLNYEGMHIHGLFGINFISLEIADEEVLARDLYSNLIWNEMKRRMEKVN